MEWPDHIQTKDDLVRVLDLLLSSKSNNDDKENADMMLNDLYLTSQAWEICKEIMTSPQDYVDAVLLTTAKILKVKMYYYLNELPESYYVPMFNLILRNIILPSRSHQSN